MRNAPHPVSTPRRRGRPRTGTTRRPHAARPAFDRWTPVHVTLRVLPVVASLRGSAMFRAIHGALCRGQVKDGFRLVHYSIQRNHLHLLVEARDPRALSRGVQGLSIRVARAVNKRARRSGRLFADRFHSRLVRGPDDARSTLRYVLNNARRHTPRLRRTSTRWLDPCSSAPWFEGWSVPSAAASRPPLGRDRYLLALGSAAVAPRTWLLRSGWALAGPIELTFVPGPAP